MRWISGEISRVKAEIPRHDARATISLASFVAKSGRVERARADPGAPKGRAMDVEFPENRGTPERRAEGARGGTYSQTGRGQRRRGPRCHRRCTKKTWWKTLCVSRLGVRAQGKVTEGAAFFSTFGLGEKART